MKKRISTRGVKVQTTPKGLDIPTPKRSDVLRDLRKASQPQTIDPPKEST